jgi:hypothetical protein
VMQLPVMQLPVTSYPVTSLLPIAPPQIRFELSPYTTLLAYGEVTNTKLIVFDWTRLGIEPTNVPHTNHYTISTKVACIQFKLLHHLASPHILLGGVYSTAEKLDSICIPVGSLGDITGPTPFNNNANINREFNYLTIWWLPGVPGENNQSAAGGSRSNRPQVKSVPVESAPVKSAPDQIIVLLCLFI